VRHLADLPNTEGFKFIGIDHNGNLMECVVVKDRMGLHSVENEYGDPCFMNLHGWVNIGETP
jgi:hypothetical protein